MFKDDVLNSISEFTNTLIGLFEPISLRYMRILTHNCRQPKFNFHWLREISTFEVIGDLTLELRE